MFLWMQDIDFCPNLIKFYQIYPIFTQICLKKNALEQHTCVYFKYVNCLSSFRASISLLGYDSAYILCKLLFLFFFCILYCYCCVTCLHAFAPEDHSASISYSMLIAVYLCPPICCNECTYFFYKITRLIFAQNLRTIQHQQHNKVSSFQLKY